MRSKQIYKGWSKVIVGCYCMMMFTIQLWGQTFAEALRAGQTMQVEWTQQDLKEGNGKKASDMPLFPDELLPGESEIRVGLNLKMEERGNRLIAEVTYIKVLTFPEIENSPHYSNEELLLAQPIILDTRFQGPFFNPRLFLLNQLIQQTLPIACDLAPYQVFFNQFGQIVAQTSANSKLIKEQLEWLQKTSLPPALSAASMADFFCQLMETLVPNHESPIQLQANKRDGTYKVDYVKVDHPQKVCMLKGQIRSPATDEVRVMFFREGDWLEYWRDTLIQLDEDGSFELAFQLDHTKMIALYHGYQNMRFYFEPGDTIQLHTNANAFYREMQLQGNAKAENQFLLDFFHQMRGDTILSRYDFDLVKKDHLSYFQKIQAKELRELNFLAEKAPSLRPGFTAFMNRRLKLEYADQQWDAAARFMQEKRIVLEPELLHQLQKMANLLYHLPQGKSFDFNVEEYLIFQYILLQNAQWPLRFGADKDMALAQLLPSKETFVRHGLMQIFRNYTDLGQLTESGQWRLTQLLAVTRDAQMLQEAEVFTEGKRNLPPAVGFQVLLKGDAAPDWSFKDQEGVEVALRHFKGKKLLVHIGSVDNLDIALTDIQIMQEAQDQLPDIVHLLGAASKEQFNRQIAGKGGLFVFVPQDKMHNLRTRYLVGNRSNHYFLIGADGKVLANHYDLGTANKLRGTWELFADLPTSNKWTSEQKLQFWKGVGISALLLLLIAGAILWQRYSRMRRDQRRRQMLEIELRGIRSQMNPHFLFNAMSSIQNLIRKQEQEKADIYLGQFAGLMRKTLRNTAEEYIPLMDEIETLKQYCSLESLRHPFEYEFQVDPNIDAYNTYIPSMILQPIIENAILHGLTPQLGARKLRVEVGQGKEGLHGTITDNGIGIIAAQQFQQKNNHKSVGMKLVRQRLALLGLSGQGHLSITDRSTLNPPMQGTIVSITIPTEQ